MTIDFKGYFQNKNHRQRKINDLGMLESRRWVKDRLFGESNIPPLSDLIRAAATCG